MLSTGIVVFYGYCVFIVSTAGISESSNINISCIIGYDIVSFIVTRRCRKMKPLQIHSPS